MNLSYCRIHLPKDIALQRFAVWLDLPPAGPLKRCSFEGAIDKACDADGAWLGDAVFVAEIEGWTLFQDLSGGLGAIAAEDWSRLAGEEELIVAGYNDAIPSGELIVVRKGQIVRALVDAPDEQRNIGTPDNEFASFKRWQDIARYVDDDELGFAEKGWLWVYREREDD
ncbi:hypothetical protein [Uliginosibacterium gangwonense]|uniref:hypothetical protein n=1 Tax=Uliginosibacterium gangwonense TaxID=392736 RepID=UPI0003783B4B|nr:hypothetical protein [Uliginosibacterium gangwonense]